MTGNVIGEKAFAKGVVEKIKQYLPPEYEDVECEVTQQNKNNGVIKTGISLRREGQNVAPIFYVESHYQEVRQGKPLEEIMHSIAEDVQRIMEETEYPHTIEMREYDKVKEYLSVELINTKANKHMLAEMPHRRIEDLSLICILKYPFENGVGSVKINNELMRQWNISGDELFQAAMENAQTKQTPVLQSLSTALEEATIGKTSNDNLLDGESNPESALHESMFVLSNKDKVFGASVMEYAGVMDKISQLFPKGFYILPSSIHEVLIFPKNEQFSEKKIGEMVREVNASTVEKSEVLSDRAYKYDKERRQICQVPDSVERKEVMER